MNTFRVFFAGAVSTAVFAFFVLAYLPHRQLAAVAPSDGLRPYADSELAGRAIYISMGCMYCHSQQVRDPLFGTDQARHWGRPSYPEDYRFDFPHLLGTMRTGPDLMNIAVRQPSRAWHYAHLYQPRAIVPGSLMPSFRFLFVAKDRADMSDEVVDLPEGAAPAGKVVVATDDARHLVDYLLSLNRDFPRSGAAPGAAVH